MLNKIYNHRIIRAGAMALALLGTPAFHGNASTTASVSTFAGEKWGLSLPVAAVMDKIGNVYVASNAKNQILKISPDGKTIVLAGVANSPVSCADGKGINARFSFGYDVQLAIDSSGNLYVADVGNNAIRKVTPDGTVTTLAGAPNSPTEYADGIGRNARFYQPAGVALDPSESNLYVADAGNNVIRKIKIADGIVTTVAGVPNSQTKYANGIGRNARFNYPTGVAVDTTGRNLYVADLQNSAIRKIQLDNLTVTTLPGKGNGTKQYSDDGLTPSRLKAPQSVAVDQGGNIYVADNDFNTIWKYTQAGHLTVLAGSGNAGHLDGMGKSASFFYPSSVSMGSTGDLCVADPGNNVIRMISPNGYVKTLGSPNQGDRDGTAATSRFNSLGPVAFDKSGNMYVADQGNFKIRKITPTGTVSTLAGSGVSGYTDATGTAASFGNITGLVVNATGNLYALDPDNGVIRTISPSGKVDTLQLSEPLPSGVSSIGLDESNGNLYVADVDNHKILKITPTGLVSTLAGSGESGLRDGTGIEAAFACPNAVAVDSKGNVYVADMGNNVIRMVSPTGLVTTMAGSSDEGYTDGQGLSAAFNSPTNLAIDKNGNLYVSEFGNNVIRMVSPTGLVTTLAGTGKPGQKNGAAATATFNNPQGIAVDAKGNVYVTEGDMFSDNLIRKITITK